MRRNWNRVAPSSLRHAMELCLEYGREKRNLSVDRVADLMGLPSKWVLYKWLESGKLPAILIRPYEHATGAHFVTQYIATSAHKLLINIPAGTPAKDADLLALQTGFNEAVNLLARFYRGDAEADATMAALNRTMSDIAGHRANVGKTLTPELNLFEEDEE
ncbi:MAG: hypothetical protein RQ757_07130 [Pseudomonadales bacterium]|nr:hypothetical protein [Pseudomonadales bacterium]